MAYSDLGLVQVYLGRELTVNEQAWLSGTGFEAVKEWIDRKLGTTFDQASASTRYYDGGKEYLDIDPCTGITAVASVDNEGDENYAYTDLTDFVAEPVNETVKR